MEQTQTMYSSNLSCWAGIFVSNLYSLVMNPSLPSKSLHDQYQFIKRYISKAVILVSLVDWVTNKRENKTFSLEKVKLNS